MVGFGEPANRQDVARWMKRIETASLSGLSPYLQVAKQFAQQNAHLIVAIDLEDVLGVEEVKARLAAFESLEGKGIDLDKASQALASIRGVTLGLTVTDRRNGAIRVDFNEDISVIRDVAKPLLLEALGNQGMMINEFRDWNVEVSEKEVRLTGILEDGGTRRLLSFLDTPPSLQPVENQPAEEQTAESLVRLACQQYFSSIGSLLGDLRNDKQNRTTMGQISVFFRNYARRIDRLPILNVDPELVSFGRWVSTSLREGEIAVTEAAGRSRVGQMEVGQANAMGMGTAMGGGGLGRSVGGGGMEYPWQVSRLGWLVSGRWRPGHRAGSSAGAHPRTHAWHHVGQSHPPGDRRSGGRHPRGDDAEIQCGVLKPASPRGGGKARCATRDNPRPTGLPREEASRSERETRWDRARKPPRPAHLHVGIRGCPQSGPSNHDPKGRGQRGI